MRYKLEITELKDSPERIDNVYISVLSKDDAIAKYNQLLSMGWNDIKHLATFVTLDGNDADFKDITSK